MQPTTVEGATLIKSGSGGTITISAVPSPPAPPVNVTDKFQPGYGQETEAPVYEGQFSRNSPPMTQGSTATGQIYYSYANSDRDSSQLAADVEEDENATVAAVLAPIRDTQANIESGPTQATSVGLTFNQGYSIMQTTGFPLSASMEGGRFVIVHPNLTVESGTPLSNGRVIPNTRHGMTPINSLSGNTTAPASASILFQILSVQSKTKARVMQIFGPGHPLFSPGSAFEFPAVKSGNNAQVNPETVAQPRQYVIRDIQSSTNFTSSHQEPFSTVDTERKQSFAEIILANMEPATGDVYKVKVEYKPVGAPGAFIDKGDTVLESTEILEDTGSFENIPSIGQVFNRKGYFTSLNDYQNYFTSASAEMNMTSSFSTDNLMSAIKITPEGDFNTSNKRYAQVFLKQSHRPSVIKNTQYLVRFNAHAEDTNDTGFNYTYPRLTAEGSAVTISKPRIDVYVKGTTSGSIIAGESSVRTCTK
jgi:hypothetical protein